MQIKQFSPYINSPIFGERRRIAQKKEMKPSYILDFSTGKIKSAGKNSGGYFQNLINLDSGVNPEDRTYDSFTGLRDKNYLLAVLNKRIEKSKENGKPLSIAMFDMDNFKSVNELLGYETGDDFIKSISNSVSTVAAGKFLPVYRFGGDEFVVVFGEQTKQEQQSIVDSILDKISDDDYINKKASEYQYNAGEKLLEYSMSTKHINRIISLKAEKNIIEDLQSHLSTEEAKNDPYLKSRLSSVNEEINLTYLNMINTSIEKEESPETKEWLEGIKTGIEENKDPDRLEMKRLDEYLRSVYDKTAELHQIKKWLSDFKANDGFSISGGVVTYTPDALKNKTPISIIDDAGEVLKAGKHKRKGGSQNRLLCANSDIV